MRPRLLSRNPQVAEACRRSMSAKVLPADSFTTWDVRRPVRLRVGSSHPENLPPLTLQMVLRNRAELNPGAKAMAIKRDGRWKTWTYEEYLASVLCAARAFSALGLERFHGVGILAPNSPEWFLSALGAAFAGGVTVGMYNTSSPEIVSYICRHAPVDILVVGDSKELQRILHGRKISEAFPAVKKLVLADPAAELDLQEDGKVMLWKDLMEVGGAESDEAVAKQEREQAANQACSIVYTSGTTGPPKGVLLSHDNLTWVARVVVSDFCLGSYEVGERILSFMPLSHIVAQVGDIHNTVCGGGTVYFADKDALKGTLLENLREVRPTRFFSVPRLWEKVEEALKEEAAKGGAARKAVSAWAKTQATRHYQQYRREGAVVGEALGYRVARRHIFRRIKEAIGLDQVKTFHVGGAPMAESTYSYFESLDIPIMDSLGSTETTAQTRNLKVPGKMRPGTIGQDFAGVENKLVDVDPETGVGELATKSRGVFMGYHADREATEASFTKDGFFRSGDCGHFDADGFLTLTGRIKEILVTSGGKNVGPASVEAAVMSSRRMAAVLGCAVVVGDGRKHLACLVTLKTEPDTGGTELAGSAKAWVARVLGDSGGADEVDTVQDFLTCPRYEELRHELEAGFREANTKAESKAHEVRKFAVVPGEFSVEGGELGPTMKLRRRVVDRKYADVIERIYSDDTCDDDDTVEGGAKIHNVGVPSVIS